MNVPFISLQLLFFLPALLQPVNPISTASDFNCLADCDIDYTTEGESLVCRVEMCRVETGELAVVADSHLS